MKEYPLFFTLTHEIKCQNFIARIVSRGRVLVALEDGEWWCHGVDPGGITDHGSSPVIAWTQFKGSLGGIFEDLAEDAGSFDSFSRLVREFIADQDRLEAKRWELARQAVRASAAAMEDSPFKDLKRIAQDLKPSVKVERLERIQPAQEEVALAEAA